MLCNSSHAAEQGLVGVVLAALQEAAFHYFNARAGELFYYFGNAFSSEIEIVDVSEEAKAEKSEEEPKKKAAPKKKTAPKKKASENK